MRWRAVLWGALLAVLALRAAPAGAQAKGEPGKFDFYLLDMPWGPAFCSSIKDVSAGCRAQAPGFVVHGLWAQNFDGTWPVFCSHEAGPRNLAKNLDITPDLQLLQHEWEKHGTCAAVGPERFFRMEHEAFRSVRVPQELVAGGAAQGLSGSAGGPGWEERKIAPARILELFSLANPQMPAGSLVVSCRQGRLTAVEACFAKDLKPIACRGLHSCEEREIVLGR